MTVFLDVLEKKLVVALESFSSFEENGSQKAIWALFWVHPDFSRKLPKPFFFLPKRTLLGKWFINGFGMYKFFPIALVFWGLVPVHYEEEVFKKVKSDETEVKSNANWHLPAQS